MGQGEIYSNDKPSEAMRMSLVCIIGEDVSILLPKYSTYNTCIYMFQKGTSPENPRNDVSKDRSVSIVS